MSPQIIIILMVSVSALLIVLLFVLRRRRKKTEIIPDGKTPMVKEAPEAQEISEISNLDLDLSELNISALTPEKSLPEPTPSDLALLVKRYGFFEGKNLETFETLASKKDYAGIEQIIREKFEAQSKDNAAEIAKKLTGKLITSTL